MNLLTNLSPSSNECPQLQTQNEFCSASSSLPPSSKASSMMATAFASVSEMANTMFIPNDLADAPAEFVF